MSCWRWWQVSAVESALSDGNAGAETEAIAKVKAAMVLNQEEAQSNTILYSTSSIRLAASLRNLTDFAS